MRASRAPHAEWSVVIPFYNEEAFLAATLRSIAAQTKKPARVVLVDNGSTDGSRAAAEAAIAECDGPAVIILREPTPGKAAALRTGLAEIDTEFVAACDADTFYPREYLAKADRLFAERGETLAAALAFGVRDAESFAGRVARAKGAIAARLMPSQAHSGGFGQCFRMSALRRAGGFDPAIWPFCLMDHEIIHRVSKAGAVAHAYEFWCSPSDRRADRRRVRWTLAERLLYHTIPKEGRDWLFYRWLAPRFAARGLSALNLRERPWDARRAHAARRSGTDSSRDA